MNGDTASARRRMDSLANGEASPSPSSRVPKEVREWYKENGIPVIDSDWGPRGESGESRAYQSRPRDSTAAREHRPRLQSQVDEEWWASQVSIWGSRTKEDRERVEAIGEFFDPLFWLMSEEDKEIISAFFNDKTTYGEWAKAHGMTRQGAWKKLRRAVTRLITNAGGAERLRARLDDFWVERFGRPYS